MTEESIWTGLGIWKIPFHTPFKSPQRRILQISCTRENRIQVLDIIDPNKSDIGKKFIPLMHIVSIRKGHQSPAFIAFKTAHGMDSLPHPELCCSIATSDRTLDVYAETQNSIEVLINTLLHEISNLGGVLHSNDDSKSFLNERYFFDAVKCGDVQKFQKYLQNGIDVNLLEETDSKRDSALIAACRLGREEIVRVALDFNAKNDPHPEFGQTALQVAVASGHINCAKLILETAELSEVDHVIVNHADGNQEAPLHIASRCGNPNMVELLINHGADVTLVDSNGRTSLHCACSGLHGGSSLRYLLQTGGDDILEEKDDYGSTPLHIAVKQNNYECVKILLEHGANPRTLNRSRKDALEMAIHLKSRKMIHLIEQYSIDHIEENEEEKPVSLFEGMTLYQVSGGLSSPVVKRNTDTPKSPRKNIDAAQNHSFYLDGECWFIFHHESGYPYYLRSTDSHSQWEDPRTSGTMVFEDCKDRSSQLQFSKESFVGPKQTELSKVEENKIQEETASMNLKLSKYSPQDSNEVTNPSSIDKYHKMMKYGLSIQTIEHKMIQDDVDSSLRENFLKALLNKDIDPGATQTPSPPLSSNNYLPTKMNMPTVDNISVKKDKSTGLSVSDSLSKDEISKQKDKSTTVSVSDSLDKDEVENNNIPQYARFRKMLSVGIPIEAVIHKMLREGFSDDDILKFQNQSQERVGEKHDLQNKVTTESTIDASKARSMIMEDDQLTKYNKMKIVGVPPSSIIHKMHQDGVKSSTIRLFSIAHGIDYDVGLLHPGNEKHFSQSPHSRRTSVRMQKIHWHTVAEERVKDSVWNELSNEDDILDDDAITELENLFGAKSPPARMEIKKISKTKSLQASLLDGKRANNIAIGLAQFRSFQSYDELCQAVASLDTSNLNSEQLENMHLLLPTTTEMKQIQEYSGSLEALGRAELFFVAILKVNRFAAKLSVCLFLKQFETHVLELQCIQDQFIHTCSNIVGSKKLAEILRRLLIVGNLVNEGAGKPKASGITLDSLLKTANKTGRDRKTRVIDVVIGNVLKSNEDGSSIEFWADIPTLNNFKTDIMDCKTALHDIKNGIEKVEMGIKVEMDTENSNSSYITRSNDFLTSGKKLLKKLEENHEILVSKFEALCLYFAEDPSKTNSSKIFEVLQEFSKISKWSLETMKRKSKSHSDKSKKTFKTGSMNHGRCPNPVADLLAGVRSRRKDPE